MKNKKVHAYRVPTCMNTDGSMMKPCTRADSIPFGRLEYESAQYSNVITKIKTSRHFCRPRLKNSFLSPTNRGFPLSPVIYRSKWHYFILNTSIKNSLMVHVPNFTSYVPNLTVVQNVPKFVQCLILHSGKLAGETDF